jgi:exodeoxyribonuclease VII small subunit
MSIFAIPSKPTINMAKKESGYRKLIEEVETILAKIESGETDIDDLAAEIKRAAKLLQDCKEKLFRTEQEVEKIMKNEEV